MTKRPMTNPKKKKCPFCGETEALQNNISYVTCLACCARGPIKFKEGIEAWNNRALGVDDEK